MTETVAKVLGELGSEAALVVHGADGLDELSTTGINRVSRLEAGRVTTFELDPAELGLPRARLEDFLGGDPEENAKITQDILSGRDQGARRDIVLLNAAGALSLESNDWPAALATAREAIDNGAANTALQSWIEMTNEFA